MLITDDFVLLNFPKTGSTFTRKIINKVYKNRCEELLLPAAFDKHNAGRKGQHGTYSQIPLKHRGKPVLSVMRNPFDRYVSQFRFGWYSHTPPESYEKLRSIYPRFPKIEFSDFLDMTDRFSKKNMLLLYDISLETDIGFQTIQFLAFFSENPEGNLKELVRSGNSFPDIPPIHFLRQESLRGELINFLTGLLGDSSIADLINSEGDENVSRSPQERDFKRFWTPDLLKIYSEKERFLLDFFPDYRPENFHV